MILVRKDRVLQWNPDKSNQGKYNGIKWRLLTKRETPKDAPNHEHYKYEYRFIFEFRGKSYDYHCWTAGSVKEISEQTIRHAEIRNDRLILIPELP